MPITNWGILVDGIIIQANDKLVIMSEIIMQTTNNTVIAAACTFRREENCALAWKKYSGQYLFFKSISHCRMHYKQKTVQQTKSELSEHREENCASAHV